MVQENKLCKIEYATNFVKLYKRDSEVVAKQLKVPTENILGLAAQESQYGIGRIATEYNNYFSLRSPAIYEIGSESAQGDKTVKVAKFSSFLASAQSFAASKHGAAVKGIVDPNEFGRALVRSGFNSGDSKKGGRDGFDKYLADIIRVVKIRMECS